ncbi:type II secretion system (T2SS), F family protein [Yersinia rohdei]|uniref:Type II secretion system (T2SS), F family protein n=1 Tax=Yersinia rohdei TaxID=29485 RepID=A0ABM5S8I0_YERRO|nr:type II secretion system F family protein [Yersinia rohdei]AJJ09562.1 type II secretion system (T2SS), F family protein [Yersinia rohdei]MDN0096772.1 type II secretion system F family protein [Yersinia rohdei]CNI85566.1 general secretion pathway protein [Yersinia rohdei]
MPVYKYTFLNPKGQKIKGTVEADNILAARHILYQKDLFLLDVTVKRINKISIISKFSTGIKKLELVLITRQMSILVNAAIPLDEVLEIVEKQHIKSNIHNIIHEIRSKVIEGYSLSDSLSLFPAVFNELYRSMIAAGEVSGHLDLVLSKLAEHIEKTYMIRNKIIQTLIYPCFLVFVSISVIIILLSFVIPNIIEQFSFHEKALPLSTRTLMTVSYWLKDNLLLILITLIMLFIVANLMSKIKMIKIFIERNYLKIPVLGQVITKINISRYLRMMAILNSNGVEIIQSMKVSSTVLTNGYIKKQLTDSIRLVSEGGSFSSSLSDSRVFSPMILHMISSGERSGQLDVFLEKITDIQEQELIGYMDIFITLLEPVIMIFMAGFVFFIVLSIFQPILEMNNLIL